MSLPIFLRPEWLWLAPCVLLIAFWVRRRHSQSGGWDRVLPPEFLVALGGGAPAPRPERRLAGGASLFVIAVLLPLAIAGPSVDSEEIPVQARDDALVVVLDLSLSMLATDVSPNRLVRARQKINDLLDSRIEGRTGLIVYAGSAHVVSPLTDDAETLRNLLPALDPLIMPDFGSRPALALALAEDLLERDGTRNGRILLLSDGLDTADISLLQAWRRASPFALSMLSIGTPEGGPIPIPDQGFLRDNGEIVIARTSPEPFRQLLDRSTDRWTELSLDNTDLNTLLPESLLPDQPAGNAQTTTQISQPRDVGYWLLLPALLLLLLPSVRGRAAVMCLPLALPLLLPAPPVQADVWEALWKNRDLRARDAFEAGKYDASAELFEDPQWRAAAAYRAGRFQEAEGLLRGQDSATARYNLGNALAMQGRLEEAVGAYDEALQRDPTLTQAADNKRRLLDLLQRQKDAEQSAQSPRQQTGNEPPRQDDQNQRQEGQNQQQADPKARQQSGGAEPEDRGAAAQQGSDGQSENPTAAEPGGQENTGGGSADPQRGAAANPASAAPGGDQASRDRQQAGQHDEQQARAAGVESGNATVDEGLDGPPGPDTEASTAQGRPRAAGANDHLTLKDQQTEEWLRRIPDDPGGLLRRKFLQQYQDQEPSTQEHEGRTLW